VQDPLNIPCYNFDTCCSFIFVFN